MNKVLGNVLNSELLSLTSAPSILFGGHPWRTSSMLYALFELDRCSYKLVIALIHWHSALITYRFTRAAMFLVRGHLTLFKLAV